MFARSLIPALLAAFAGVASAQGTAPAAEAPAEPAAAASAAAAAPAAPTGSNLPKTVCETEMPADLDQMRQRALDDLKHTVQPGLRAIGG